MGIELKTESVEKKLIRRCNKIEIIASYGECPIIVQEYETITLVDGEYVKRDDISRSLYNITDLYGVEIDVDGVKITGEQISKFFLIYNDLPK